MLGVVSKDFSLQRVLGQMSVYGGLPGQMPQYGGYVWLDIFILGHPSTEPFMQGTSGHSLCTQGVSGKMPL